MVYKKYLLANNAKCLLSLPIDNNDLVLIGSGNFNRFPASNFIIKVTEYDTDGVTVIGRENMYVDTRVTSTFTINASGRAYESVPYDDDQTSNTQTALPFSANSVIELVVSGAVIKDIQDEVTAVRAESVPLTTYNTEKQVFGASSAGDDDYEITSATVTTLVNGQTFKIQADVPNNGPATLQLNALGAKALEKLSGGAFTALATGDIIANQIFWATYNSVEDCFQFSVDPATAGATVADADETTKGIVERDTDAEALGFIDTTRFTNAHQLGLATTLPEQVLPYVVSSNTAYATNNPQIGCDITDTGVIFLSFFLSSTTTIQRYEKQARTGEYVCTHETTLTTAGGPTRSGLTVLGSYLYLCTYDAGAGAHVTRRYNIADLSGVTTITISGTIPSTNVGAAFNDGTYLYFPGASSQYYKYSISGTTITYVTSITYTTSGALWNGGAWSDGVSVWIVEAVSSTATIRKYALAGGAASATKDFIVYNNLGPNNGRFSLFSGKYKTLGFGRFSTAESNSAVLGSVMKLSHVAQF